MKPPLAASFFFCTLLGIVSLSWSESCSDGKLDSRMLPSSIGYPSGVFPVPCYSPFDTVEVREGDTCRIYSGVKFHFGNRPSQNGVILVKGTLIVEGIPRSPTVFAGSLQEFAFGLKPGTAAWKGFRIEDGGALTMKHAGIYNASVAIDSKSENVRLENVWTKGCLSLVRPGEDFFPLAFEGMMVESMDFSRPKASSHAFKATEQTEADSIPVADPAGSKPSEKVGGHKKNLRPLIWTGVGLATAGVVGTTWLYLASDSRSDSPSFEDGLPRDISVPTSGPRLP